MIRRFTPPFRTAIAEIARKFADEAAKVARKRVPPLRRPQTSVPPRGPVRRSWWPFRRAG